MKKLLHKLAAVTGGILFWQVAKRIREKGIRRYAKLVIIWINKIPVIKAIRKRALFKQLATIVAENPDKPIFVSLSFIDWNVPLFQRPQHVARQLAKLGILYFYHTRNYYDAVNGCEKVAENLYLIDDFDAVVEFFSNIKKTIHVYSTNMYKEDDFRIKTAIKRNDTLLYEYIDEISEKIAGRKIPKFVYNRHLKLLKDERSCLVIATATKLYQEVATYRKTNMRLVTNGVTLEDFQHIKETVPGTIKKLIKANKPIIGYYGALAHWFDYELIKKTAKANPQWNFLLIGWDYDGSLKNSGILKLPNIAVVGPIPYSKLAWHAQYFTVCTIPFHINLITNSTSPVKIFEYMALGKPIVTTAMPECKKYDSVLIAENTPESFTMQIAKALALVKNKKYLEKLHKDAVANTWENKAKDILALVGLR